MGPFGRCHFQTAHGLKTLSRKDLKNPSPAV